MFVFHVPCSLTDQRPRRAHPRSSVRIPSSPRNCVHNVQRARRRQVGGQHAVARLGHREGPRGLCGDRDRRGRSLRHPRPVPHREWSLLFCSSNPRDTRTAPTWRSTRPPPVLSSARSSSPPPQPSSARCVYSPGQHSLQVCRPRSTAQLLRVLRATRGPSGTFMETKTTLQAPPHSACLAGSGGTRSRPSKCRVAGTFIPVLRMGRRCARLSGSGSRSRWGRVEDFMALYVHISLKLSNATIREILI
jgi:hypothetical protein